MEKSKADLRKEKLKIRKQLSLNEVNDLSQIITNKLFELDVYKECNSLLIYSDYNNEVKTDKIIDKALSEGKNVFLPKVYGDQMEFYCISKRNELISGTMGILEPQEEYSKRYKGDETALVIIPLSVFDRLGNRIGYGGGYYDKYLANLNKVTKIGLAYSFQENTFIPNEITDIRLDNIITELEIIEV